MGPWSLPFAKFFPGLSIISVAMAGVTKISLPAFLLLNGIGAFLSVSVPVVLGRIFHDAITDILSTLAISASLAFYLSLPCLVISVGKMVEAHAFIRQLRMDRITVDELRGLIDQGRKLLILDVRPQEARGIGNDSGRRARALPRISIQW